MRSITRRTMVAGLFALPALLAACTKEEPVEVTEETTEEAQEGGALLGGWQSVAPGEALVSDEARSVFEAAVLPEDPSNVVVAELARQVVSGTNHAFLSYNETVGGWGVHVVYENLSGDVELISAASLDPAGLSVIDEDATEGMLGAWQVVEQEAANLSPAEAQEAFELAMGSYVGMDLRPIACLARQVVSGTNYLVLCEGSPVVLDAPHNLYVATVYADLEGNAEFQGVEMLDLLAYIGM